jgi:hypothetical protein
MAVEDMIDYGAAVDDFIDTAVAARANEEREEKQEKQEKQEKEEKEEERTGDGQGRGGRGGAPGKRAKGRFVPDKVRRLKEDRKGMRLRDREEKRREPCAKLTTAGGPSCVYTEACVVLAHQGGVTKSWLAEATAAAEKRRVLDGEDSSSSSSPGGEAMRIRAHRVLLCMGEYAYSGLGMRLHYVHTILAILAIPTPYPPYPPYPPHPPLPNPLLIPSYSPPNPLLIHS